MTLALFEAFGIEAEYMIVESDSLNIKSSTENVLRAQNNGDLEDEVEVGEVSWSNELVSHVIEIKGNGPKKDLPKLEKDFHQSLLKINQHLENEKAQLLPTAMHPWMNPYKETKLWPHGSKEIYEAYNRIFNCQGHGWSNLQSVHINLPWKNDEEFGRLHAAVRLVLPLIPGMAASSPIVENHLTSRPDNRLLFYHENQKAVPSITGAVIPEAIFTLQGYQDLLKRIFRGIAPHDPDKILQHQWLNSRGAINKFDLQAIEIRLMDIQECPHMDFAIIHFVVAFLKAMVSEKWIDLRSQKMFSEGDLRRVYDAQNSYLPVVDGKHYLQAMGIDKQRMPLRNLMDYLLNQLSSEIPKEYHSALEIIMKDGHLSQRLRKTILDKDLQDLKPLYSLLGNHLKDNVPYQKM